MDEFQNQIEAIRDANRVILDRFEKYLKKKKLSKSTINKHVGNIDLFINDFLLYYEPIVAKEGSSQISIFLGDWFIRKAMWASVTSIKENITSIKKFYQFLLESGEITNDDFAELKEEIRECKDDWLENLRGSSSFQVDLSRLPTGEAIR